MTALFVYLALGAAISGLAAGDTFDDPIGYVVAVTLWPFIAITVAAAMLRESVGNRRKDPRA